MDADDEIARFKWLLIAGCVFLISAYYSYRELKYQIWGATAEARVVRIYDTADVGRRGRRQPKRGIEYTFPDTDGSIRKEHDTVSLDWPVPEGTVSVQYVPGVPNESRLEGHSSQGAVWLFFGSLVFVGASVYRLAREAKTPYASRRRP